MSIDSLHNGMMSLWTPKDGDIHESLSQLQVWYKELAGMEFKISDGSYMTYICQACSPSYCNLFKSINITAKLTEVSLMSNFLINSTWLAATEQHVEREDDTVSSALAAVRAANIVQNERGQKNGHKSKEDQSHLFCENCKRTGHTKPNCWAPGGGAKGQRLHEKKKQKGKQRKNKTAAIIEGKSEIGDKEEDYVAACIMDANINDKQNEPDLCAMSDFAGTSRALVAANITHNSEVIDTGATHYFSPIQSNF
ncbi:hypothetical protein J3R30DRAFT_3709577 [Lentinula aciculospora]|uniref:CCHC-type domain-containing protein n=1 Tax=Lentinula aciculospora TaxID=153920 RepID=A0A9W9A278_9AGAR|nr:hypothetical protein J3R30DRAFT_3709577 [Lentinula aciculospora]